MRLTLLALLALAPLALAQDSKPKPDPVKAYVDAAGDARAAARAELLAMKPDALRAALKARARRAAAGGETLELSWVGADGKQRPFWLYVPKGYDPSKRYPLIVSMHGGVSHAPAGAGGGAISYWKEHLGDHADKVFLVGPSAVAAGNDLARWWRPQGAMNVLALVARLKRRYAIDPDRVFTAGMSDGASGSFAFAYRRPDSFAGYFPFVGHPMVPASDKLRCWNSNLAGARIYAIQGGRDRLYPAKGVVPFLDAMKAAGAALDYKVYPEAGHDLTYAGEQVPLILGKHVASWTRDSLPRQLDWTTDGEVGTRRRAWLEIAALGAREGDDAALAPKALAGGGGKPRLGISLDRGAPGTITVGRVTKDSAAAACGLRPGDVLLRFDGQPLADVRALLGLLNKKKLGEGFKLVIRRGEEEKELAGRFPKPVDKPVVAGRVVASWEPGKLTLRSVGVRAVRLYLTREMFADGQLAITRGDTTLTVTLADATPLTSAQLLDHFDRTGEVASAVTIAEIP